MGEEDLEKGLTDLGGLSGCLSISHVHASDIILTSRRYISIFTSRRKVTFSFGPLDQSELLISKVPHGKVCIIMDYSLWIIAMFLL